jgi:hypothetical protein
MHTVVSPIGDQIARASRYAAEASRAEVSENMWGGQRSAENPGPDAFVEACKALHRTK